MEFWQNLGLVIIGLGLILTGIYIIAREGSSYGKVAGTIASEPEWHKGCTGCWRTIWH
jgi:hypothetical protein